MKQEEEADRSMRETPPEWDEPPPFLGTWRRVYWSVVFYTAVLVLLLYGMTVFLNR